MPVLTRPDGSSAVFDTPAEVQAALAAGWSLPGGQAEYVSPSGHTLTATPEQQALRPRAGDYGVAETATAAPEHLGEALRSAYSGPADQVKGFAEGAGSVLSFGLTDVFGRAVGTDVANRDKYTAGRTVGEVAAIAGTVLTPTGVEGVLGKLPTAALSEWTGGAATALGRVARTAGEGAAYGLGQEVSNIALSDPGFAAEGVISQLAIGSFLGAAFGAGGGLVAEGAQAGHAAVSARRAANQVLREPTAAVLEAQANVHKTIDEMVDYAGHTDREALTQAVSSANAGRLQALTADVDVVNQSLQSARRLDPALADPLRSARSAVGEALAAGEPIGQVEIDALWKAHNTVAARVGAPRLSRAELREAGNALAAGDGGPLEGLLTKADEVLARDTVVDSTSQRLLSRFEKSGKELDGRTYLDYAGRLAAEHKLADVQMLVSGAAKRADEAVAELNNTASSFKRARVDREPARLVLGHVDVSRSPGPEAFARIFRLPPEKQVEAAHALGKYYDEALAATAHNPVAQMRIKDALTAQRTVLDNIVSPELQSQLTPTIVADILGTTAAELALPDTGGPTDDILKFLAVHALTRSVLGRSGPSRSIASRIIRSIGRHAAGSVGGSVARMSGMARGLPEVLQAGVVGGGYAGGRHAFDALAGGSGLRGVVQSTANADEQIAAAVSRIGAGKPSKRRAMPALDVIFNKLLPDDEHKAKKPAQKFSVIQDRLSQYGTSPQSFGAKFYEMLRPVQQVSEHLADAMETTLGAHLDYAAANMPHDPGTMMMLGKSMWHPTDRELYEFGLRMLGVTHPLDVVDMVADGLVPPQAVEALRDTNPAVYSKFQAHIIDNVDDIRANSTYDQRIALGLAFGLTLDPTTDARYVTFIQSMHAQKSMEQAAGNAAEPKNPEESYTSAQKMLT